MRKPYQRCHPVRDEDARRKWRLSKRERCHNCGAGSNCWPPLSVHHIVRFRRSDEPTNLLLLCGQCHGLAHDDYHGADKLTVARCCALKQRVDPGEFNKNRLEELYGSPIDLEFQ